jgi:hypothetical protein
MTPLDTASLAPEKAVWVELRPPWTTPFAASTMLVTPEGKASLVLVIVELSRSLGLDTN